MKLNEKEALRYLGFRGKPADADTDEMIREIGGEMLRTLMPKCVYKRYDIKVLENAVELDGWRIESIKLSRHLRGCKAAYLFAATLGLQADMMIRRLSALNMARGTVAHSVANALIEDYCDEMQAQIAEKQQTLETSLAEQQSAKEALAVKNNELRDQRTEATGLIKEMEENEADYKDVLAEIEAEEEKTQKEIVRLSKELAAQQGNTTVTYGGYIWPVTTSKRVTSPFGKRNTGIKGASTNHRGIDIGGVYYSSTVYAAKAGTVIISSSNSVRGQYIVISHGSGNTTTYQHLSKRSVSVGAVVKQGQAIGVTGSSGVGSGPHLHFEITENGQLVNPLKYLTDYVKAWN